MAYTRRQMHQLTARRRRMRTSKKIACIAGGAIALALLIVLFLALFTSAFEPASTLIELSITPTTRVAAVSGRIYYLNGTTLHCVNTRGEPIWSSKFSSGALDVAASDALVCVYGESFAAVLAPDQTQLFTLPASEMAIEDVVCGSQTVAILSHSATDETSHYIRVFDAAGNEIYRDEHKDVDILQYGLCGANDNLWTLTLDATGVRPISRIMTSNPAQKALTGTVEIYDQLVSDIFYFDSEMFVSGTTSLVGYNTFGDKLSDTLVYGLKCIDTASVGKDYILAYILRDAQSQSYAYTARIIGRVNDKAVDTLIQLPPDVLAIHVSPSRVYCFLETSANVYQFSGQFERTITFDQPLSGTRKLSSKQLLVTSGETVFYMDLP